MSTLKTARERLGWSQTDLAFKAGRMSPTNISRIERGERQSPASIRAIVKALNNGLRKAKENGLIAANVPALSLSDLVVTGTPPRHRKRRAAA